MVPPYTPSGVVEYTFTDKENPEQSNDQWQVAKVKVTLPAQVTDVTATWEPRTGYNLEDPTQMYRGTATGPLSNLTVDLMDPVHVHCGLAGAGSTCI